MRDTKNCPKAPPSPGGGPPPPTLKMPPSLNPNPKKCAPFLDPKPQKCPHFWFATQTRLRLVLNSKPEMGGIFGV